MLAIKDAFWVSWLLIVYTYLLYPLALALMAKARRAPTKESLLEEAAQPWSRVAMVVAAYNEGSVIAEKLLNTWRIDYPADLFSLYVGSDGSSDATSDLLRSCSDPRLHAFCFETRRGKISVLNDLMSRVDAEIVVLADANTMFDPDAVRQLVKRFNDPSVGCVSGELALEQKGGVSGEGLYWKYEGWIKRNEGRLGCLIGCNGGIYAIRKELYESLPASTIVDDFVLSMNVLAKGYRVIFSPEARAFEPPCPSAKAEMVRKIRIGAGNFQALGLTKRLLSPRYGVVAFAYWGHKVLRWMVPLFLAVNFLANLDLVRQEPYLAFLMAQAAGVLIASWAYHKGMGQDIPAWVKPISYFYLMNYALFCGFLRFLFSAQRVTWERAMR
jgi:cellulose synthase/poly-beta-1,6-N-acetylglucosamine synthase-like glycosyltransferase